MIVYKSEDEINIARNCVLALGNFDGVHRGHRSLLERAAKYAKEHDLAFGVYTFEKHPRTIKSSEKIRLLTQNSEKIKYLSLENADFVFFEDFGKVMDYTPEAFVEYIRRKFSTVCTFCGENFRFGKSASGNCLALKKLMEKDGLASFIVPTITENNKAVSSTQIRLLLEDGNAEEANNLLGHPYSFVAKIVHGQSLGHTIGFPTINQIIPREKVMPKFGVYAVSVEIDGKSFDGVANIGTKPTVSDDIYAVVAETYIIDFDENVYGKTACVSLYKMLRSEKKFSGLDELTRNIRLNVEQTKMYFKGENK